MGLSRVLVVGVGALALVVAAAHAEERAGHRGLIGPIGGKERVEDPAADDCCGLDARLLAARCAAALRAHPGRVHPLVTVRMPGLPAHPAVAGEVLVRLKPGADPADLARKYDLELRRAVTALRIYGMGRDDADPAALAAALAHDPAVVSAGPNWIARCSLTTPNDELFPTQLAARDLELERAWDDSKGAGVTVAVLDTGVDAKHPDLVGAVPTGTAGWADFVNASPTPFDDNGHGTAMCGIIAARFQNSIGTAGVAPEASLLAIKVADRNGVASFADLIAGVNEAVQRGAKVINLSLGSYMDDPALKTAIDNAVNAGALVVAAAGNENVNAPSFPAAYPGVLAVGGSGSRPPGPGGRAPPVPAPAEIAFSTAIAPSLALLAPAEKVVAPLPGGVWAYVNGTSAAAAHAAGVAALVRSHSPGLDRARLEQVLRQSTEPLPALGDLFEVFPFGRLNARAALARDAATYTDIAVVGWAILPLEPQLGQPPLIRARIQNQGNAAIASAVVKAQYYDPGNPIAHEISPQVISNIAVGETRSVDFVWGSNFPTTAGTYDVEVVANPISGETEIADNTARRKVTIVTSGTPDVEIARLEARPDYRAATPGVTIDVLVRNLGNRDEADVDVAFVANGVSFQTVRIPRLFLGSEQALQVTWPLPATPPERVVFSVEAAARAGEVRLSDNVAESQVRLGVSSAKPVEVLYQQGNDVDLISDAPFRIAANRPYVPLLLFAPSKGDPDPDTYLTFSKAEVYAKDDPAPGAPATLIYRDATSGPLQAAISGLVATDEMGTVQPTLDIFQDQELKLNGRHMLLRVPRSAWTIGSLPSDRYLDVRMDWEFHRKLFWIFNITRSGSNKKVLRVTIADGGLPELSGEGHYYDVHHHTIAEWFFSSWINVFAPRKAYGGPILMTAESAYAIGMIDSPTNLRDLVTTTDHNTFYNVTIGDPNDRDHRPPFGPTSPAASVGSGGSITPEHERYREIFGRSAGEEIAVKADQNFSYSGITVNVPMGAHMVSFRGEHVEGPWHGGGWIPDPGSPNVDVPLPDVLRTWATTNQPQNGESFIYAAHPFSNGLGWPDTHRVLALGLDPAQRSLDYVHASPPAFVFKGFQLFNGRGARSLPYSVIDFDDLNPWIDATWQAGNPRWDGALTDGLVYWHGAVADLMTYAFTVDPDGVFVRKVFIAGGSDAHGDYNFDIARLATPITLAQTFSVGSSPYACVRTYVLGDGFPGATPGERFLQAFAAGRSMATDGPVVAFTMDSEGRFDAATLKWHDRTDLAEDDDGRMGGGGAFDGLGTMLVRGGTPSVWFRYSYACASDFGSGSVAAIKIYKDSPGNPNPSRSRAGHDEPVGVGSLAVTGTAAQLLSEKLDPNEEGLVTAAAAFSLGAYTGGDPDVAPLGVDEGRCYSNPVWTLPVDVSVRATHAAAASFAANEISITLDFPISMDPLAGAIELKPLDKDGNTTDASVAGIPLAATWSKVSGARNSRVTLTNPQAVALTGDAYPSAAKKTFAVYFRDPPKDLNGNALNRFAFTFGADAPGAGGSTSSPTTAGPSTRGHSSSAGGCTAGGAPPETSNALSILLPYIVTIALSYLARRRRRTT